MSEIIEHPALESGWFAVRVRCKACECVTDRIVRISVEVEHLHCFICKSTESHCWSLVDEGYGQQLVGDWEFEFAHLALPMPQKEKNCERR